ncbi:MAG: putative phosphoribosyltransferase [Pedosphaera sp.]|nr:putative phosphoribosyltransferase [Pedosphaera sp.]
MANLFQDRTEAGQVLTGRLEYLARRPDVLVLALSRGGTPVAAEVARELRAPLDVFLVRPLGIPGHEELAMGAVTPGGVLVVNEQVMRQNDVSEGTLNKAAMTEGRELERREKICREDRPPVEVAGRIVILTDDGRASSVTLRAAIVALRQLEPSGIILGLPVAAPDLCAELETEVEQIVCLENQEPQYAVGLYYRHYPAVTDEEVCEMLRQSAEDLREPPGGSI